MSSILYNASVIICNDTNAEEQTLLLTGEYVRKRLNDTSLFSEIKLLSVAYDHLMIANGIKSTISEPQNALTIVLSDAGLRDIVPKVTKDLHQETLYELQTSLLNAGLRYSHRAALSRITAGTYDKCLVLTMRGERKACKDILDYLVHMLEDLLAQVRKDGPEQRDTIQLAPSPVEPPTNDESSHPAHEASLVHEITTSSSSSQELGSPPEEGFIDKLGIVLSHESGISELTSQDVITEASNDESQWSDLFSSGCVRDLNAMMYNVQPNNNNEPADIDSKSDSVIYIDKAMHILERHATNLYRMEDSIKLNNLNTAHSILGKILTKDLKSQIEYAISIGRQDVRNIDDCDNLERGTKIRSTELSLILATGLRDLKLYKKPNIRILSNYTDHGLIKFNKSDKPDDLITVHSVNLVNLFKSKGHITLNQGIWRDELELECKILASLQQIDVLIITGNSNLARDLYVLDIMKKVGCKIHFDHVNISPGGTLIFASKLIANSEKYIFCLPGNPVEDFICSSLFILPFLEYNSKGSSLMNEIGESLIDVIVDTIDQQVVDAEKDVEASLIIYTAKLSSNRRPYRVIIKKQGTSIFELKSCDCLVLVKQSGRLVIGQTYKALRV